MISMGIGESIFSNLASKFVSPIQIRIVSTTTESLRIPKTVSW